jgi:hypothetical protein
MSAMMHFATLVITTMFAAVVAMSLSWILLRTVFVLMQPATARKTVVKTELARGAELARAFAAHR